MKKKVKRFQEGGFSAAQEEWLGGADRTDPYILARMRSAVPDAPKTTTKIDNGELRDETGEVSKIRRNTETGDLYSTEAPTPKVIQKTTTTIKTAPKSPVKSSAPVMPAEEKARMEKLSKSQALERVEPEGYIPGPRMIANLIKSGSKFLGKNKLREYTMDEFERMTPKLGREPLKLGMKKGGSVKKMASGGKVSSASSRGDGCAIRGKTKGRMI